MSKKRLAVMIAIGVAVLGIAAAVVVPALIKRYGEAKQLEEELADGFNKNISVEIPAGRYYYNGDISLGFYIEVYEDETIQIVNLPFEVIAENERVLSPELTDEDIQEIIDNIPPEYFTPTKYNAIYFPDIDYTGILIFWNGSTGSGYQYSAENTISWGMIDGSFILIEGAEETLADSTVEAGTLEESTLEEGAVREEPPAVIPSGDETCYYDDVYKSLDLNPTLRVPITYDEVMTIAPDPRGGGLDSFYLLQVVRPLTLSECEDMGGWFERFKSTYGETFEAGEHSNKSKYMYDYTLYEVIVLEDLISGEQLGHTAYVLTSMGIEYQDEYDPPYAPNDRFTAALSLPVEGYDFVSSLSGYAFRYDVVGDTAYSRNNDPLDELAIEGSEDMEERRITSTTKNPVLYTQKLPLEALVDFLREDWESRGAGRHYARSADYYVADDITALEQRSLPDDMSFCGHGQDYHTIELSLINHMKDGRTFDNFLQLYSGTEDMNIVKFIEYAGITQAELDELIISNQLYWMSADIICSDDKQLIDIYFNQNERSFYSAAEPVKNFFTTHGALIRYVGVQRYREYLSYVYGTKYDNIADFIAYFDIDQDTFCSVMSDEIDFYDINALYEASDGEGEAVSLSSTLEAITFPAHQYAENSYNDELLDIEPFTLSVSLPEGWYTALPERSEYDDIEGLLVESSAVYIYDENGKQTGKVDYNTFDLEALAAQGVDITEKLPYRAVYSDIMLANHLTWDCDYTEVKDDGTVNSATCKVMMSGLISESGETEYSPAALAYSSELQVYVQFQFDEGSITDAELKALARSVDISR